MNKNILNQRGGREEMGTVPKKLQAAQAAKLCGAELESLGIQEENRDGRRENLSLMSEIVEAMIQSGLKAKRV